ncbi:hypothetical protein FJZ18_02760 [Candidatus Pacearchaeota archaeon]|nr:hypothetical protein [Candidatus Pacearchaeota archaeon]
MNRRGQELSVGTLILIVLGIVLLVLLILGFSLGWSNLWEKINIFSSTTSLESIAQKCSLAVTSGSLLSYCESFTQITFEGKKQYVNCEYPKLNLDKTLTCSSEPRKKNKCIELIKAKFADQFKSDQEEAFSDKCTSTTDLIVNGDSCSSYCKDVKFAEIKQKAA